MTMLRPILRAVHATPAFVAVLLVLGAAGAEGRTYGDPTSFPVGAAKGITTLPNGEVWSIDFLDIERRFSVVKIGPSGSARVRLSGATAQRTKYTAITLGPDGNVWIAARRAPYAKRTTFYRVTPAGAARRFVPSQSLIVYAMTPAPDGTIWFIDARAKRNRVGRLTLDGRVEFLSAKLESPLGAMAQGADGSMWIEGRKRLYRFDGTKLAQRFIVQENVANGIAPLADGRVLVPGRFQLQIAGRGGVEIDPVRSSPADNFPILSAFVTAQGRLAFTSGGPGGDDNGATVSGSGLSVLDGQGASDYDPVFTRGINWVPNFDDALENSLSPGVATVAIDPSGNLWAGTDLRRGSGLAKFPPLVPVLPAPGSASIEAAERRGRSFQARLTCVGGLHQFCSGAVKVDVRGAGRSALRQRFVLRTGTRTTVQFDLRRGESIAGRTLVT